MARGTGRDLPPWSIGVYCPICGDVWARVINEAPRREAPFQQWIFKESVCVAHIRSEGTRWDVPGSIIPSLRPYAAGLGRDYEWENNLPPAIMEREALLHLRWWAEGRGQELVR